MSCARPDLWGARAGNCPGLPDRERDNWSSKARLRFEREAKVLSLLEHPGICPLYEIGSDGGFDWFAMRYVEGVTLAEALAQRQFGVPNLTSSRRVEEASDSRLESNQVPSTRAEIDVQLGLVERVARIVHYAHELGVVHRDIKPSNIVVSSDGSPVVLDFGTAVLEAQSDGQVTATGEVLGTPSYMSPEQLQERPVDRRSDVWSLGVTLYECLTSERPFSGSSRHGLIRAIFNDNPVDMLTRNPAIPSDVQIVLDRVLQKNPRDRCPSALDLAEDLRRIREREPIRARPVSSWVRTKRWGQRNPVVAWCSGLTFAVLASCLVVTLDLLGESRELTNALGHEVDEKAAALARSSLLADSAHVARLLAAGQGLWPRRPDRVPHLEEWLQEAEELLARGPEHAEARSMLMERAGEMAENLHDDSLRIPPVIVDGSPTIGWRVSTITPVWACPLLDDHEERRFFEVLVPLEARLEELDRLTRQIRERVEEAKSIRTNTVVAHSDLWEEAIAAIHGSIEYGDLSISPQVGLVPLGRDQHSGLWEFWQYETGKRPEWKGERLAGCVVPRPEMSLVFVLLPGRRAENDGAGGELAPIFLSKFEIMQSQWERVTGSNPSELAYAVNGGGQNDISADNPVEYISWEESITFCAMLGLNLPSRKEWEYACGGTQTTSPSRQPGVDERGPLVPHHSVGRSEPNRFGLFDMDENVSEWWREISSELSTATAGVGTTHSFSAPFDFKHRNLGVRPIFRSSFDVDQR